jgi:hypothetical protein
MLQTMIQLHNNALALLARVSRLEKNLANDPPAVRPIETKVVRGKGGRFEKKQ